MFGLDPDVDGEQVRSRCGVVSAKPALYDRLSGYDNLAYSAELYGLGRGPKVAERIRAAAHRFGIEHALDSKVGGFSTGMKTRLALARSILHEPDLLLFDEPTSGLDPESSHAVLEMIREMTGDGRTVLMCTHLLMEAEGLAEQIIVLEAGDDIVSGSPLELSRRFWPNAVVRLSAEDPATLEAARDVPGVRDVHTRRPRGRGARRRASRCRPRRRAHRLRRPAHPGRAAEAHARGPLLRRAHARGHVRGRRSPARPDDGKGVHVMNWSRVRTVARTDLKQLIESKDFWLPMVILGAIFFFVIPVSLLFAVTRVQDARVVEQLATTLEVLPKKTQAAIPTASPAGRTSYALAVFLLAPVAIVVPLTISTAVGAATLVGERERGTGEFLAHTPAHVREIYLGKLIASIIPGYLTTIVGFGVYSLVVNVLVGPEVGHWFFPTKQWWILMFWVVPPFLALTLSIVLRLSARVTSTAAAQQASGLVTLPLIGIAYSQATGALFGASTISFTVGAIAWVVAGFALARGMKAVSRQRLLGVADGI